MLTEFTPNVTTTIKLNSERPRPILELPPPNPRDFPTRGFKNMGWQRAMEVVDSEYVRHVIEKMMKVRTRFRHAFVDVKVHHLLPGDGTTRDGFWHLDSSLNGEIEYDNFLFVTGQYALTEFVVNPMEIFRAPTIQDFNASVEFQLPEIERIKSCTITRYNGRNVHRGPISTGTETRLLVRVIKTNRRDMPKGGSNGSLG